MGNTNCFVERKVGTSTNIACKPDVPLSRAEIALVAKSWKLVRPQWQSLFSEAFNRWIKQFSEVLTTFEHASNLQGKDTSLHCIKEKHTKGFELFIDNLIHDLNNNCTATTDVIIEQGKRHHYFGAQQKFATALAHSIKLSICEYLSKTPAAKPQLYETVNAWDSILQYVAGALRRGMREGAHEDKINDGNEITIAEPE